MRLLCTYGVCLVCVATQWLFHFLSSHRPQSAFYFPHLHPRVVLYSTLTPEFSLEQWGTCQTLSSQMKSVCPNPENLTHCLMKWARREELNGLCNKWLCYSLRRWKKRVAWSWVQTQPQQPTPAYQAVSRGVICSSWCATWFSPHADCQCVYFLFS